MSLIEYLHAPSTIDRLIPLLAITSSTVAATNVCWLSFIEHRRSIRPSDAIVGYLLASVVCDSLWIFYPGQSIHSFNHKYTLLIGAQLVFKFILLLLECRGKESALYSRYRGMSAIETAGLLRGALFWWVNPILAKGSKQTFQNHDIPEIGLDLSSEVLREAILKAWHQRGTHFGPRRDPKSH
jgi:ATP-binding cassette subfamily C (CFTR/MRP) protein 1